MFSGRELIMIQIVTLMSTMIYFELCFMHFCMFVVKLKTSFKMFLQLNFLNISGSKRRDKAKNS